MAEPVFILRSYSGEAQPSDLSVPDTSGGSASSFTLAAAGTWLESHGANAGQPLGTTGPFVMVVDAGLSTEEHVLCSLVNTSTGVVTVYNVGGFFGRGYEGTTAQSHGTSTGTGYCYPIFSSVSAWEDNQVSHQLLGSLGASGTFVKSNGTGLVFGTVGALPFLIPTAQSNTYAASNGDFVKASLHAGAGWTISLPTPSADAVVGIQSVNGTGATPFTISSVTSGGAIFGPGVPATAQTILLGDTGSYVTLLADGTNWNIVAGQQDSGWITFPTFGAAWSAGIACQYRLTGNVVRVRGELQQNSGTPANTICTFPVGYRPTQVCAFSVCPLLATLSYSPSSISLQTTGVLGYITGTGDNGAIWLLDGIAWTVD
jgi:hypothetical protein